MNIRKLPSGNYNVRVYDKAADKYYSATFPSKAEAKAWGKQMEFEVSLGVEEKRTGKLTVSQAIGNYIQSKSNVLSPSTIAGYTSIHKHRFAALMPRSVFELTNSDIQEAVNVEAATATVKSLKNACGLLFAALTAAGVEKHFSVTYPQKPKASVTIPTEAQIQQLFAETRGTPLGLAIMLAATAGMRRGEICALTHSDISGCTVTVNKSMVQGLHGAMSIKPPKSAAGYRSITIPQFVADEIAASKGDSDSVIGLDVTALDGRWRRLTKRLGINVRFHDLRHYHASVLHSLGVPDKYAMERMGHSTETMLRRVYQHLIESKQQSVDAQITDYFKNME